MALKLRGRLKSCVVLCRLAEPETLVPSGNEVVSTRHGLVKSIEMIINPEISRKRLSFEHYKWTTNIDEAISFSSEEKILPDFPSLALHDPCRITNGPASVGCGDARSEANTRTLLRACPEALRLIASCAASCVSDNVLLPKQV